MERFYVVLIFILFSINVAIGQCGGGPCEVCGVSATITSISGGTINNGTSTIPGQVQAGATGIGTIPLEVTATTCGEISLEVQLNFDWDHGLNQNWIHGISFDNSPGWSAATGILPGPGWIFLNSITGTCSGVTYGAGYYYDPPGTGPDAGNGSSWDGTDCNGGGFNEGPGAPWLIDGDPADNFGDNCTDDCPPFGFSLSYCPITGGQVVENISFYLTEDGESGGWSSSDQCVFLLSFDITINSAGVQLPPTTGPICEGSCVVLDAGTGCDTYLWSTNETTPQITVCPTTNTIYGVTVTGSTGCVIEGTTEVLVQPCCDADAGMVTATPAVACPGEVINFSATGFNADPLHTQVLLVIDAAGNIVNIFPGSTGNVSSLICEGFTVYSYNYLTAGMATVPTVGAPIAGIDCAVTCCDLVGIPISFEDTQFPVFPAAPPDEILNCHDLVVPMMDLGWTDNCDGSGMVPGMETGSIDPCLGGSVTRTWEYTDACGNMTTHTQNISADPIAPPVFQNVPPSMTVACDAVPASFPDLMYTNNGVGGCLISGTVPPTVLGSPDVCGGTIIAGWTFTDQCGNSISTSQTITVDPAPIPTFVNPPADMTVDCDAIPTSAPDLTYTNNATGICLITGMATAVQSGTADVCGGAITFTWTATDPCGNPISHVQTITVNPAPPAAFINPPADMTVTCDAIPTSAPDLAYTNNGVGACEISGMVSAVPGGSATSCGGTLTNTWTATDACGVTFNHVQTITVTPAPPTVFINPPANMTVNCDAAPSAAAPLNYTNNAVGSCLFEGTVNPVMGGSYDECGGAITFTWNVTDPCGVPVQHIQTITVNPAPAPNFTSPLPGNFSTDCASFSNTAPTLDYSNNALGNCLIQGSIAPVESGSFDECGGAITYDWNFTDACGNSLSHTQTVTINPAPPAVFTSILPQDFTTDCANFINNPPTLNYSNSQTGACLIAGMVTATQQGSFDECGGAIIYQWQFIDNCGRTIQHIQTVTIDPAPPAVFNNPPGPITVNCSAVSPTPPSLTYTNNQSGVCTINGSVTAIQSGSFDACGGNIIYTWTFTDNCNRTITHAQNVIVNPASEPAWINPPPDVTINCGENLPTPDPLNYSNGETGNCSITGSVLPAVSVVGNTTIYFWTFTNPCSGLTINHSQTISQTPEPILIINPQMIDICAGESFDLSSISVIDQNGSALIISYHSGSPAGPGNIIPSPFVSPTMTTTYYILGTNQFGCTDEAPFTVNVEVPPNAGQDGSGTICYNAAFNVNLFDFLVGPYDPGGMWDDFNGYGVNLNDPQNVNIFSLAPGTISFNYLVPGQQFCPPDIATITITILDEITIDIVSVLCTGTDFYTIVINNPQNYLIVGSAGIVNNSTPGIVTITAIPITENIVITALDPQNLDCLVTQSINAPDCDCPAIDPPDNDGNQSICDGDPIPDLTVTVPAGQTANWYDVATGGTALLSGSLTFTPTTSGPGIYQYYVEAEDLTTGCVSLTRTPVQLEISALPNGMDAILSICDDDSDGFAAFTLSDANGTLSSSTGVGFTFYPTLTDAENGTNALISPYTNSSNPETIFVVIENGDGCSVIVNLTLDVLPLPTFTLNINNESCLDAADGSVVIENVNDPMATYSLDGITWQTGNSFPGLSSGNYTAYVQDQNGCINALPFDILPGITLLIDEFTVSCDPNGTASDASDDFYTITFIINTNPGTTGNYELFIDAALNGSYTYGSSNTITLPADGSSPIFTFSDIQNGCTIDQQAGPLNSCSTDCIITIDQLDLVCNDNGSDLDATDDFYTVTINASAINGATNNSYNVLINGAVSYNFPYATISTFTLPADGASPIITIVDNADLQCTASSTVGPLIPCSNGCFLTINNIDLSCDDNGTVTDPLDDFYLININTTVSNPGSSGQFEVFADAVSQGIFTYGTIATITLPANGTSPIILVQDVNDANCFAEQQIGPLNDCAAACILNATFTNILCSDNGTGNDLTDDTFTFEVTASGTNVGSGWSSNVATTGIYDAPVVFGPFLITDGVQNIVLTDDVSGSCSTSFSVNPPPSCSDPCAISITNIELNCDDNGTVTNPTDDFYLINISTTVTNPGSSGQYEVFVDAISQGIFNHGTIATITLPADGASPNITVEDVDFSSCSDAQQIGPLDDCAGACIINATFANIQCDDNGTGNDPTDDTFTFEVTVSGTNIGVGWASDVGPSGNYDTAVSFGPFPISNGAQSINITDDVTGTCATSITVDPPAPCSDPCALSITNIELNCDDNGTVTNPTDDFYLINISTTVTNPGSSGQYEVFADAISQGIFTYGTIATITLPANGASPNITVEDVDFSSCSDAQQIGPLDDCAGACIINATFANIQCDDNGTGNDPTDDTFTFEVTVSGTNVGGGWTSDVGPSGNYDTAVSFGPFPISNGAQSINITDDVTGTCATSITVDSPAPCSDPCAMSITNIELNCDDNGTVTNPADDFYLINISTTVTNPGSSGQYEVFADAISQGIFTYGTIATITLPADGTSPNITVEDVDFSSCSDAQQIGPLDDCAGACIINATFANIQCDDNGTGNDPTDDTFTFEVTVSGTNIGGGWTSDVGPSGNYDIAVSFGPFPISNGAQSINITDDVTGTCATSITVDPPARCSDPCALSITNIELNCDDNGTVTNPTDDFYLINISTTVTNPSSSGQYEVFADAISQGIFIYGTIATITLPADGASPNITVEDVDFSSCSDAQQIGPLNDCAVACIINASFANIQCDDNGTGNDPTDDTFTFEVTVSGTNVGSGWNSDVGPSGNYDTAVSFGPFPISNGAQSINITDDVTGTCATSITVDPPAPCSDPCALSITNIELNCDDNGTATDPADDFYLINITTAVTNSGNSGQYEVFANATSQGIFNHGTIATISLPANGTSPTILVEDIDFAGCSDAQQIGPLNNCAVACIMNATFSNVQCDDNGTGNDSTDDTFTFDVTVSGTNIGSNWISDDGTIGAYDILENFGPYLIADGIQTLNFSDDVTPGCSAFLQIPPPAACSSCPQTVDAGIGDELSCTTLTVTLTATSSQPGVYQWTGPNGFVLDDNLMAVVNQPGIYYFNATYIDNCMAIDSVEVTIDNAAPQADGGPDAALTCIILDTILTGVLGPNQTGQWFNEAGDLLSSNNILFVNMIGNYYYQITDNINGCMSPLDEVMVLDEANVPLAIIYAEPSDSLDCIIDQVILTSPPQDNVVYSWDVQGDIIVALQIQIDQAGTYGLIAVDTLSGCSADDEIDISDLEEYPLITIDPADEISCYDPQIILDATGSQNGPTIIYTWLDQTGSPIPGANASTLLVENGGTYFLQLVDTLNGCENIDTVVVETLLNIPLAEAGDDVDLPCDETEANLILNMQGSPASANINWSTNNGIILSGGTSTTPAVNGVGYYYVEIQDIESGCSIVDSILVTNNPDVPEATLLNVADESCIEFENGALNVDEVFGGEPPYTFTLNGVQSNNTAVFNSLAPGFYALNVADINGCEMDTSFIVAPGIDLELDLPTVIELIQDQQGVLEGITNVDPNELTLIQWTPADLVNCDSCLITEVYGENDQEYTLTIVHENGCFAIASIRVLIRPEVEIYIPNAFSPNGDGNNDSFTLFANEEVEQVLDMIIVDRWGEIVFRNENFDPNNLAFGWDGKFLGEKMNPAVFVYVFRVKLLNGSIRQFSGDVTLVR